MGTLSIIFISFTITTLGLYAVSRCFRGRIRTHLGSIGILLSLTGLATATAFLAVDFGWAKSDVLSLVGLLLTIVLTLFASEYVRSISQLRVGVVIPSLRPFHRELRQGLREILDPRRYVLIDPYVEGDNPEEDLSNFIPVLQHALNRHSDVLVVCASSVDLANSPALIKECEKLTRRGGHVFFIESVPSDDILQGLRFVTALVSDSRQGAVILSQFVRDRWNALPIAEQQSSCVLIIPGPQHSRPASERLQALQTELVGVPTEVVFSLSWTSNEAAAITKRVLQNLQNARFICCGNDDMARGAALACFELGISAVEIVGHDGLYDTIVSIADPFSPLSATVRIPPKAFGFRVGALLEALPTHWGLVVPGGSWFYRRVKPETIMLPITRANLVTRHNAPLLTFGR